MASKRKSLCIDEKVLLIRSIKAGEKISDVGRRFGFSRSTVSTIWKNKEKILQAEVDGKSAKKLKKPQYEDLDQAMLSWFYRQRQNNMPVSGPIMKAKAKKIAEQLGLTTFKASEGWLGKFKQRHHINYYKMNGEALTDQEILESVRNTEEQQVDEEEEKGDPEPPPSIEQALDAAKLLEKYFLYNQDDPSESQDMSNILKKIQLKYWRRKKHQTKITDYTQ
ncbi:tigger transposable element-derived protein 4-like isoform X1 [Cydia splendana]|uniref:tigger transposable element-derived protein 4-like isoform X1 n=1 Tax=Cydia splendana TaxID=1100963 RepID=UPI00300D803D